MQSKENVHYSCTIHLLNASETPDDPHLISAMHATMTATASPCTRAG